MFGFTYSPRHYTQEPLVPCALPFSRCQEAGDAELSPPEALFRGLQSWPRLGARLSQAIHFQRQCRGTLLSAESFAAEMGSDSPLARTVTAGLLDAHAGVIVKDGTATDWAIRSPLPGRQLSMAVSYGRHLAALDPLYRIAFRRQFDSRRAAGHCDNIASGSAAKIGRQFFLQQTEAAMRLLVHLGHESRQQGRHDVVLSGPLVFERLQLPTAESGASLGELLRLLTTLRFAPVRFSDRDWRPELLHDSPAITSIHWIDRDTVVASLGPEVEEAIRVFSQSMPSRVEMATASDA